MNLFENIEKTTLASKLTTEEVFLHSLEELGEMQYEWDSTNPNHVSLEMAKEAVDLAICAISLHFKLTDDSFTEVLDDCERCDPVFHADDLPRCLVDASTMLGMTAKGYLDKSEDYSALGLYQVCYAIWSNCEDQTETWGETCNKKLDKWEKTINKI